jgi:hypothetical protein
VIDLTITIGNHNTKNLIRNCLNSIYSTIKTISYEIIVVDNVSTDDSVEMLKTEFPKVKLIVNQVNRYFGGAHNQGLRAGSGRYLTILSSDTILMDDAFDKIVRFMDEHPDCGACGPKLLNADHTDQCNGLAFPTFMYGLFEVTGLNALFKNNPIRNRRLVKGWDRNDLRTVDTLGGSCIILRKEVIDKVGVLDENFLAYWEETDWCLRIWNAGWKIYLLPEAKVLHIQQQSLKQAGRIKNEKIFYDSMMYYYKKHFGVIAYAVLKLFKFPVGILIKIKRKVLG